MIGRTDLALEYTDERTHTVQREGNCTITRLIHEGESYITMEVPALSDTPDTDRLEELTAMELRKLLPAEGSVLVVGVGNRAVTPDALGPLMAEKTFPTRHIKGEWARVAGLSGLRSVSVISPGVLGCTGIESGEAVRALAAALKPSAVIAVDALAAKSLKRLGCTVQLSTAGLSPGHGVGNKRPELNRASMGIPVISLGIPTVVEASLLAFELLGREVEEEIAPRGEPMVVTPREIDLVVERGARLLAMAVNRALNPSLSREEFRMLVTE